MIVTFLVFCIGWGCGFILGRRTMDHYWVTRIKERPESIFRGEYPDMTLAKEFYRKHPRSRD
jgi:hypothetical protein